MIRGSHHSPETCAKMSDGRSLGRQKSPETRAKMSAAQLGARGSGWKGGKTTDSRGHTLILRHDHPQVRSDGYVLEHRLIMEQILSRPLLRSEVVHHGPGGPGDNRIENLVLCNNRASHIALHRGEIYLPW